MLDDPEVQKQLAQKIRAMTLGKCLVCKGTGYKEGTETVKGRQVLTLLPCRCVQEFDRLAMWARSGIPERYWTFELTQTVLDKDLKTRNAKSLHVLLKYIEQFDKMVTEGVGLYLTGEVGLGKSAFAACVLKEALRRNYSGQFVTLAELVALSFESRRDEETREYLHKLLSTVDLLVVDEIDKVYKSREGQVDSMLDTIFRSRYFSKRPMVVTSNLTRKELPYGTNIADILAEVLIDVILVGPSMREKRGKTLESLLR